MKKRVIVVCGLLGIVASVLVWYCVRKPSERTAARPDSGETKPASVAAHNGQAAVPPPDTSTPKPESNPAAWIDKRREQMEEERKKGLNEWRTPIEFFGKVTDENNNTIAGADVDFVWTDLSAQGSSEKHSTSDVNGFFSLRGVNGKHLVVRVSKPGYYAFQPFGASFPYAGENQNFVPSAADPVVFRLKKKGVAEPLVHVHAPMGGSKGFRIAKDGTAVEISLMTGRTMPLGQGDLRIECQTDDQGKAPGQRYDWKCQLSVPKGGLVQATNDLDFQAPMDGYRSSDAINMPATLEADWSSHAKRTYFLKLANGDFARVSFEMVAGGDHFFQLESFLNPSGSRNLEFDPAKEITPKP
jgi:hypothetical protein